MTKSDLCVTLSVMFSFAHLTVHSRDLPSSFRASTVPSVNFPYVRRTFYQLSLHPRDLLPTSVSFSCVHRTFSKFLRDRGTFKNVPESRWTFHQLHSTSALSWDFWQLSVQSWNVPSAYRASARPSVNFLCISRTFIQIQSTFRASAGPSINFRCIDETLQQLLVRSGNFRLLPERQRTSVNFCCCRGPFQCICVPSRATAALLVH